MERIRTETRRGNKDHRHIHQRQSPRKRQKRRAFAELALFLVSGNWFGPRLLAAFPRLRLVLEYWFRAAQQGDYRVV